MINKILYSSFLSLSFLANYKLYTKNDILKKEKSYMFELYKNAINEQIYYINKIKKTH
jgi:hypothetical protein